jgi:hypothetical protein
MAKRQRTPKRDKLKEASQEQKEIDTKLFEDILSTNMDYVPDYDTDLSLELIKNDSAVEYWFKGLSDNSQNSYTRALEQYCLYRRLTPKQLLNEAIHSKEEITVMRKHILKLNSYCQHIEDEGYEQYMPDGTSVHQKYAPKTILAKIAPIQSFYQKFGISIPKKSVTLSEPPEPLNKNENKSKEAKERKDIIADVIQNDKVSDLMKCIILGQTSSGLLPVDILKITIGQYKSGKTTIQKAITDENGEEKLVDVTFCKLILKRQKNESRGGHDFITFFSPEACQHIDAYLKQRNTPPLHENVARYLDIDSYLKRPQKKRNYSKYNKYIRYLKQRYDIDIENGKSEDDLLLFVNQSISNDFIYDRDEKHRKITTRALRFMYVVASEQSENLAPLYEKNKLNGQNMRSFFSLILEGDTSKPKLVKQMMGHKAGALDNAYYKPDQKKIEDFYVGECLPRIQFIETESMRLVDKDYQRLQTLEAEHEEQNKHVHYLEMQIEIQDIMRKYDYQINTEKAKVQELEDTIELMADDYEDERFDGVEHWTVTKSDYLRDLESAQNIYNLIVAKRDAEIEAVKSKYRMNEVSE